MIESGSNRACHINHVRARVHSLGLFVSLDKNHQGFIKSETFISMWGSIDRQINAYGRRLLVLWTQQSGCASFSGAIQS